MSRSISSFRITAVYRQLILPIHGNILTGRNFGIYIFVNMFRWIPACAQILIVERHEWTHLVPAMSEGDSTELVQKFFSCLASLMSTHLRSLVINSLADFVGFLSLYKVLIVLLLYLFCYLICFISLNSNMVNLVSCFFLLWLVCLCLTCF